MTETRYTITGSGNPGVLVSERADGQRLRLTGYGAVFYNPSDNGTSYQLGPNIFERISPECFDRAVRQDDVRALFNHDPSLLLGRRGVTRRRVGTGRAQQVATMGLSVDNVGLKYSIDLPSCDVGRRVAEACERFDITGSSFSFRVLKQETYREGGLTIRELLDVKLLDCGPVTFPAYEATTASAGVTADMGRYRSKPEGHALQLERDQVRVRCDDVMREVNADLSRFGVDVPSRYGRRSVHWHK